MDRSDKMQEESNDSDDLSDELQEESDARRGQFTGGVGRFAGRLTIPIRKLFGDN